MPPVLKVENLYKHFPAGRTGIWSRGRQMVHAVDGVSFSLERGEVLALAGESGCGKSTLAQTLMGLEPASGGRVVFEGQEVNLMKGAALNALRRHMQMVFQDPYESLNPLMSVAEIVAEPLEVHRMEKTRAGREARVRRALEDAGLTPADLYMPRLPHELSGGQRQRVAIAAALVLEPALLLADEPVSMLDVSIRAEILNLLEELRRRRGISILFITHDLATTAHLADRVAIMYLGRIVEIGPIRQVLDAPLHPYTRALLSVIPVPNPRRRRERVILQGAPPNAAEIPPGCRFAPRCPQVFERCHHDDPQLAAVQGFTQQTACWLYS